MALRRSHAKSRLGCLSCKKRRIKCGEESPSCQNCIRRQLDCTYNHTRISEPGTSCREHSTSDGSPANSEQQIVTLLPLRLNEHESLNQNGVAVTRLQELQLMLHYINSTCETMTHSTEDIEIWRTTIPAEAVIHEFLMDGLLALSSLHFAFENPDSRLMYTELAVQYQNSGLRQFHRALDEITENNFHALFAFSIIIPILAFAFPGVPSDSPISTHSESLVSISELLLGVGVIVNTYEDDIRNGKFQSFFQQTYCTTTEEEPDKDVKDAMLRLRERADSIAKYMEPDRSQIYIAGIASLELAFEQVTADRNLSIVVAWSVMISRQLLAFFKQRDPMAQLIFIHYGVLLLHAHDRWWGRNFGIRLIESLTESVCAIDREWACWTEWATRKAAIVKYGE